MNVLLADDDPVLRAIVQRLLESWHYTCIPAVDGNDAWDKLQDSNAPNLVILDWEMPGKSGVEIIAKLRAAARPNTYSYILLLTSKGAGKVFEALTLGADDYLTKPFDPQELRGRLYVGTRILALQRELVSAYEAANYQASHDHLTGLLNRRVLVSFAQQELDRSGREGRPVTAILCDVDHFKQVNDTQGHFTGDKVLVEVAERVRSACRSYDQVGRYGGEEFLVIAANCDAAEAAKVAERIRQDVSEHPIKLENGQSLNCTLSLGVAVASPNVSLEELLNAADEALYEAKHNGRNCWEMAGIPAAEDCNQPAEKLPT
jgi:diguanylate cyclase (GGDEF)-like protein